MAKDSEEESSEDEGNEYYTGGHKRYALSCLCITVCKSRKQQPDITVCCSGQVVKGAPKNKVHSYNKLPQAISLSILLASVH